MQLSPPLRAAIGLGAAAAVVWLVTVTLSQVWDVDVDFVSPILGLLMVSVVIAAGVELSRHERTWVRVIGVLLIVAAVIFVLLVLLTIWFLSALCDNGCN